MKNWIFKIFFLGDDWIRAANILGYFLEKVPLSKKHGFVWIPAGHVWKVTWMNWYFNRGRDWTFEVDNLLYMSFISTYFIFTWITYFAFFLNLKLLPKYQETYSCVLSPSRPPCTVKCPHCPNVLHFPKILARGPKGKKFKAGLGQVLWHKIFDTGSNLTNFFHSFP